MFKVSDFHFLGKSKWVRWSQLALSALCRPGRAAGPVCLWLCLHVSIGHQPWPPPATQLLDSSHINREKVEPSVGILFIFKNIAIICPGDWRWRCRHCCLLEAAPVQLQLQGHASCAAIMSTSCCSAAVSPLACNNTSPDTVRWCRVI